jgi:hypothetical protein
VVKDVKLDGQSTNFSLAKAMAQNNLEIYFVKDLGGRKSSRMTFRK